MQASSLCVAASSGCFSNAAIRPCLPHNAFKKLPPWSGMSRDAYLDFDPPQSRRRWLAKIAIENHARH
jgi:hypothetical protein